MRGRIAWVLMGLTAACAVLQTTLLALADGPLITASSTEDAFPLATIGCVVGAWLGALIVSHHPDHRIGWLLLLGQLLTAIGLASQAYGRAALTGVLDSAAGGGLAVWVGLQTGAILAIAMLAALFLLAPDGRLLAPRWRWAIGVVALGLGMHWFAMAFTSPSTLDETGLSSEPTPLFVDLLRTAAVFAVFAGLMSGIVSLVKRLRRASGEERQQLRWIVAGAAALGIGTLAAVVGGLGGAPPWVAVLPLTVGYLCVPVFTGVAVLRFRLYDVDLIVSRTIVFALLSVIVAAGYVAVVIAVTELVDAPAEGTFWPSLLAMALVAVAVQPLRRRVEQAADRLVYGAQAQPYEALADFSRSLHDSPDPDRLLPQVAEAVGRAVSAHHVAIWISGRADEDARATWPDPGPHVPDLVLPVTDGADELGGLSVTMRPGRRLRPSETQLLRDFTVQLARAFRNIRLESELAQQVEQLATQADELAASRTRLLAAQAVGRHRFEAAINREVLPHLAGLPDELARMAADGGRLDNAAVEGLLERTTACLEALRTLTRGVFPAQLTNRGLVAALSTQLQRAGAPGILRAEGVEGRRFGSKVESAVYFCAVDFLRELDPPEDMRLGVEGEVLSLTLTGRATADLESSTRHLGDRVAALGGTVLIGTVGQMATMHLEVPVNPETDSDPALLPGPREAGRAER